MVTAAPAMQSAAAAVDDANRARAGEETPPEGRQHGVAAEHGAQDHRDCGHDFQEPGKAERPEVDDDGQQGQEEKDHLRVAERERQCAQEQSQRPVGARLRRARLPPPARVHSFQAR